MAATPKLTTMLTGLKVAQAPFRALDHLYSKILRVMQKLPPTYPYRMHTEKVIKDRTAILISTEDIATVEEKIGCGQVEELIVQAENELLLARKMSVWKPWEPLVAEAPEHQWTWPPTK
ncbi:NADH dehydrogenase [ubiquinone] 1 alpha subcomplex subunit 5 [Diachasma alloeum]|uniref:13 kDa subunit B, NADH-dehydrogenase n=1 Tax=Diachasma alloeum TaxID=454923 RepID=A0A4E0RSU6_9HYME|nr:NADH dehydrogenase [ubiquinone] 1 alpha subcomplex subunit 5 [Diachasma alloeum]THK33017.1 13 kDA subunit B, NADH-dehydrogenase [Diachasma alloeum]